MFKTYAQYLYTFMHKNKQSGVKIIFPFSSTFHYFGQKVSYPSYYCFFQGNVYFGSSWFVFFSLFLTFSSFSLMFLYPSWSWLIFWNYGVLSFISLGKFPAIIFEYRPAILLPPLLLGLPLYYIKPFECEPHSHMLLLLFSFFSPCATIQTPFIELSVNSLILTSDMYILIRQYIFQFWTVQLITWWNSLFSHQFCNYLVKVSILSSILSLPPFSWAVLIF